MSLKDTKIELYFDKATGKAKLKEKNSEKNKNNNHKSRHGVENK